MKIKFAYNEPMIGELETDAISEEDAIHEIERQFPEAIDIEIIETTESDNA